MVEIKEIKKVCKIIDDIRNTNSLNEKVEILEMNKDNELLKKVLLYTYDYTKQYKMTSDKLPEIQKVAHLFPPSIDDIFSFLDKCCEKEALTNRDKETFVNIINYYDDDIKDLFKCIIDKDLNAGMNVNIINRVFGDFIPTFDIMLAESSDKIEKFLELNNEFYVNYKYDGVRLITILDVENKSIEFWSRKGRKYVLPFLESDILNNFNFDSINKEHGGIKKIMFDGELVLGNNDFQFIMRVARRKNMNNEILDMLKDVKYYIFDCVINECYNNILRNRLTWLKSMFMNYGLEKSNFCKIVDYWVRNSENDIINDLEIALNAGYEGLVLKSIESIYKKERCIDWVKVKEFDTIDAVVLETEKGKGALKNVVAKLICSYYNKDIGEDIIFSVGSGLNDKLRNEWTEDKNKIIGKVIEVKYQELFDDGLPRFPVFIRIRDDK